MPEKEAANSYVLVRSAWINGREWLEVVVRDGIQFRTLGRFDNQQDAERTARRVNRREFRGVPGGR